MWRKNDKNSNLTLDAPKSVRYNPFISCEAEITDEYDLLESRVLVKAWQETIVQMDRRARKGNKSILRRVETVISRGMCWHFRKEPEFNSGNKVAPREHRPCFGVSVETRAFLFATKCDSKKMK